MELPDDRNLVDAVLAGNKQAYAGIVDRYKNKLYGLFRKMGLPEADAQDLTQDTLFKAYRKLASQRPEQSFAGWLYTIAVNLYRDRLRRKEAPPVADAGDGCAAPAGEAPEASALRRELRAELDRLLDTLPEHYRLALVLRYTNQLSHEEIAGLTGMSVQQVNNALHRAKQSLRKKITAKEGTRYEFTAVQRSGKSRV
ncbi:sigma-70 family RNA polymerase sigma factor [Saccharibacillus sp. CPCC 101409]|uniref:RNA polymerase sigma factor n=1 Tax=Saccharibacillus sp. CPCC 101409 TaxID=3058041 RepID=UPI00267399AA|nr:sigma-70 family RNA polymerase sigma factor [Saccharibacillus sp. CPCC 101409]MDO3408471.1 sigma-70 family RNA polymerase sigma factor [Saccharibacillus sp. CPCC 101409]